MRIAVAGLSVRMMAEAVAREGGAAVAIDLFGDIDTRRAASRWLPIGRAEGMQVDADALLAALHETAARGDAEGWVAGSGFEAHPEWLERGAAVLPLIGTAPAAQRRLRDPRAFFDTLDTLGVPHPETCMHAPARADDWLAKDGGGSGGWQVMLADHVFAAPAPTARYWQRSVAGEPMSATFMANGRSACVLGFNRLLTRRSGMRPHVFRGVIGPVSIDDAVAATLRLHIDRLTRAFGLRGLCSLDFMLDESIASASPMVLEINARPPGSMCLYPSRRTALMRAHVRASLRGRLPAPPRTARRVRGFEIVFANRAWTLDDTQAAALATRGDCHDLPAAGTSFQPGDPVCSVTVDGVDPAHVAGRLARAVDLVALELESTA